VILNSDYSNGLISLRGSNEWVLSPRSARTLKAIPYISRSGHIHATTLAFWRCDAYELYASVASTVYKRLVNITRKIRPKSRPSRDTLIKISLVYSLENNDSWFNRTIAMLFKEHPNRLKNFVYRHIKQMDETHRFLLGQALNVASWLQRRSGLNRSKREKSAYCEVSRSNVTLVARSGLERGRLCARLNRVMNDWSSVFRGPVKHLSSAVNSVQSLLSLEVNPFRRVHP